MYSIKEALHTLHLIDESHRPVWPVVNVRLDLGYVVDPLG